MAERERPGAGEVVVDHRGAEAKAKADAAKQREVGEAEAAVEDGRASTMCRMRGMRREGGVKWRRPRLEVACCRGG